MKVVKGLLVLIFVCFMCSDAAALEMLYSETGEQLPVRQVDALRSGPGKSEVKEKEIKEEEPAGLKPGTVIPQDILKRITQYQKDLNYSNLQQIAIKLAIEKYQALWTKEFDVWLASEKVPLAELSLWTISGNKAVLKGNR